MSEWPARLRRVPGRDLRKVRFRGACAGTDGHDRASVAERLRPRAVGQPRPPLASGGLTRSDGGSAGLCGQILVVTKFGQHEFIGRKGKLRKVSKGEVAGLAGVITCPKHSGSALPSEPDADGLAL